MPIHIENTSGIVRFYEEGHSYENKDTFSAVAFVQFFGKTAFISGMMGKIKTPELMEMLDTLLKMGYTEIKAMRKGKLKTYSKELIEEAIKRSKKA